MFCRYCREPEGHCAPTCNSQALGLQQSNKDQLDKIMQSRATSENSRRRNGGSRTKVVNLSLTKVNVTAYPAAMHLTARKPIKLEKGAPVNIVFTLDATYDQVLFDVQDRLIPYPTWKRAEYELATSDGAMIIIVTPVTNFPFNLTKVGKNL